MEPLRAPTHLTNAAVRVAVIGTDDWRVSWITREAQGQFSNVKMNVRLPKDGTLHEIKRLWNGHYESHPHDLAVTRF